MVNGYNQEYDVEDMVEVTQDSMAVAGITFKELFPLLLLILIVSGVVGGAIAVWIKAKKMGK